MLLFTSESVTMGHPDKVCDQISDAILDEYLKRDPYSRVAIECLITTNKLVIAWEVSSLYKINYKKVAQETLARIGYDSEEKWFDYKTADIEVLVHEQSPDIAQWVDHGWAGDQWIMFWFATNESDSYLPMTLHMAHQLTKKLEEVRINKHPDVLFPDGKSQVTIEYWEDWTPRRIDTIVVSAHHSKNLLEEQLHKIVREEVIDPVCKFRIDANTKIYINPTGAFTIGWPAWDTWLTGRKIIVDTYWGMGRHGGWAFSGKDPTKVDRSWAYMCRAIAKTLVRKWWCDNCEVQLGYAIGIAQPVSIHVHGTRTRGHTEEDAIEWIQKLDLSPNWIIKKLNLRNPIYQQTAFGWHFWKENLPREMMLE